MAPRTSAKSVDQGGVGQPLQLELILIDEDPGQPRQRSSPGFSDANLRELAATIQLRGVKTPISVRRNPAAPGRYIINHGERRVRASRLAGKTVIPAFIDDDYSEVDQVIENLQRNQLTAREIADFVGRELSKGRRKGDIAASIGKSAAFVSQHAALLSLPEPLELAFSSGRITDVTLMNELLKCYRQAPDHVVRLLADGTQDISRRTVLLLRDFLNSRGGTLRSDVDQQVDDAIEELDPDEGEVAPPPTRRHSTPVVQVVHKRRPARLLLTRPASDSRKAWLRYDSDGAEAEVSLADVRLAALVWAAR